jgi:patatin-like phospholipase/acyl hydrolase
LSYRDRVSHPGPKRLLAIDGGGIRGVIAIEILGVLESRLRDALGSRPDFVLADYFDYVAGTSTGAIIATCVAKGFSVERMREFFREGARSLLTRAPMWQRFNYQYLAEGFTAKLQAELGEQTLGDESLRTLLMLVLRNADTDSPWPLSNNPLAKYNDPERPDSNLNFPLWQLVRASTAAPTYFRHEEMVIKGAARKFVDGAVSVYNNPAFLLFLMATLPEYRLRWPVGEDQMLLVSVGTGSLLSATDAVKASQMTLLYNARHIPSALLNAASVEQDVLCRVVGRCRFGQPIDREIGPLTSVEPEGDPFGPRKFTYMRYTPELTQAALNDLGLPDINAVEVQSLLSVGQIENLQRIGHAYANRYCELAHFGTHAAAPHTEAEGFERG